MLGIEPDLTRMCKVWDITQKNLGTQSTCFGRFLTSSKLNGEHLRKETRDGQFKNGVRNCDWSIALSHNFMNYVCDPQTAYNRTFVLPGFRKCCQPLQTEAIEH